MLAGLRLVCWAFAIFFACAPVALEVATSPEKVGKLLIAESYVSSGRDLILAAIAVLAIGLIDSLEALLQLRNRRTRTSKVAFAVTFVIMITIFVQLFVYAYWSAHVERQLATDSVYIMLTLIVIAAMSALFARIFLVASPSD